MLASSLVALSLFDIFQEEFILMATFGNKFSTLVQEMLLFCPCNDVLFCFAKITMSCTASIRGGICSYTPF